MGENMIGDVAQAREMNDWMTYGRPMLPRIHKSEAPYWRQQEENGGRAGE
jgi:hypothetical protein